VIWQRHKRDMEWLRGRQSAERATERDAFAVKLKSISMELAKAMLMADRANAPRSFHKAPDPVPERQPMPPPERFREAQALPKAPEPPSVQSEFNEAVAPTPPPAVPSRAAQIKRDMAVWRKRNEGRDFGREL
jgi:hypothetical protein